MFTLAHYFLLQEWVVLPCVLQQSHGKHRELGIVKFSLRSYRKRTFICKIDELIFIPLGSFAHRSWCLPLPLILCQVLSHICLVWVLCLFSSSTLGRGVPETIHGSTFLVSGSRSHQQALPCGAGLCHDMHYGCSHTRHKQCPEHVPVAELFVIMVFLSIICFLPAFSMCCCCYSHQF